MKKMRKYSLKDYLIPHQGNGFKPLIFGVSAVAIVLVLIVLIELGYLVQTKYVFNTSNYVASVLPGVLIEFTNTDRAKEGVPALTADPLLTKAAQLKADDMAEKGYFSHVAPDGKTPWYWLDQVQYSYTYAGENLAVDFTDSKDVEDAWMASPAHHANLLKSHYTHVGIGVARGKFEGRTTTFVVQLFATPSKKVAVAKVPQKVASVVSVASSTATVAPAAVPTRVLGAEIAPTQPAPTLLARVAASPLHTVTYVLSGLAIVFAFLLLLTFVVHVRIQFVEVLVGGFLIVLASLSLLAYNTTLRTGEIPLNTQSASVIMAL